MKDGEKKNYLYYDGSCPMCTAFANSVESKQPNTTLVDATIDDDLPASREAIMNEMYLIEEDGNVRTGPDAVLTSFMKTYPRLSFFVTLMRLEPFNWLSRRVYFFIASRRKLWFGGTKARLYWLYLISLIGLLSGILMTLPLWSSERLYPLSPVFPQINLIAPLTGFLVISLIGLIAYSIFATKRFGLLSFIITIPLSLLVLLDITRLQPWILHYSAILALLTFWQQKKPERELKVYEAVIFIIVGIYLWSGLQKINVSFFTEVFPWFTEPIWSNLGSYGLNLFLFIGILVPFIEAGMAIGFLTKKFRTISIALSFLMLTTVLFSLVGHSWNSSVWPWNLALFAMVIAIFYKSEITFWQLIKRLKYNFLAVGTIMLFIVTPSGNMLGYVDHYLAWSLYSGRVPTAELTASQDTLMKIYPEVEEVETVDFSKWSMSVMNIVPYPEDRVFESIFKSLCTEYPNDENLKLTIKTPHFFYSNQINERNFTCSNV
jgi:predicted DCC family thiol-disulfide oxidoreductase YuxK